MTSAGSAGARPSILIIGASRGLGHAMAAEFTSRDWQVVGTVRGPGTPLHALAAERAGRVEVETLDMTAHDQIRSLGERLTGRQFEVVFINGGVVNRDPSQTMAEVPPEQFVEVMLTNVLGAMWAVEAFGILTQPGAVVGVMSSGQGSIANTARTTSTASARRR